MSHSWPRTILESTAKLGIFSSPIHFATNTLPTQTVLLQQPGPFCSPVAAQDLEVLRVVSSCFLHLQQPHAPVRNTQDLHITSLFTL